MRVAYFDLGYSKEEYCLQPRHYGGGAVAARYAKEDPDIEFHVFAPAEALENMGPTERHDRCHVLDDLSLRMLRAHVPVDRVVNLCDGWDLVVHPHTCETLVRGGGGYNGPIVQFCGFDGSAGHPGNDYVLLYDDSFKPQFGERAKYVRIGKPVPTSLPTGTCPRESMVFQCSRHDDTMNTISVAKACLEHNIRGVFAGPIHNGYRLLDYIDGKTTVYLGEISEEEKLSWYRRARLFTLNHTWPQMPFNQSVIEAQGQGTPIWANGDGYFLSKYLKHGVNGWDSRYVPLHEAFSRPLELEPCWRAAREFDVSVMIKTFKQAFEEIVTEWRTK